MSPTPKKQKTSDAAVPLTQNSGSQASSVGCLPTRTPSIDVEALMRRWTTPNRDREERSTSTRFEKPLRGGEWVVNQGGAAATLSFCFEYTGARYGLTVGHLANMGDSIFAFAADNAKKQDIDVDDDDKSPSYPTFEIGTVVSKSKRTDSLVFKFTDSSVLDIKVDTPLLLAKASGLADAPIVLPDPNDATPRPKVGAKLVGYGAQRRGAVGVVHSAKEEFDGAFSRKGNISIIDGDDPTKSLTDSGDCGTIFVGLDGTPLYFHHCAQFGKRNISFGFPLSEVLASHTQLGGASEQSRGITESDVTHERQLNFDESPFKSATYQGTEPKESPFKSASKQVSGLKQFKTHIVPTPLFPQTRDLAQFDVCVVPMPKFS